MSLDRRPLSHPSLPPLNGLRLYGRRVMMRPLVPPDFPVWSDVRLRNEQWLLPWEPSRLANQGDPTREREVFSARCAARDRDRQLGVAYAFGLFVDGAVAGEVNLNNLVRGAQQSGTIGYWIDQAHAGHAYVAEGVCVLMRFAFEELRLHRLEICIIPRNDNSRRVMDKLRVRDEGIAVRFLEINGVWEDHVRYGITAEEWNARKDELVRTWL
jgi:ribosomal-protein-alanine N-acetyltransferase